MTGTPAQRVLAEARASLRKSFRCAAFDYPTLDRDIMPASGLPVFITRPGRYYQGALFAIDDWAAALRKAGHQVTVFDQPEGEAGTEFDHDSQEGRALVDAVLAFLQHNLEKPD